MQRYFLSVVLLIATTATAAHAENYYSPGGWATLHRDAGNRRSVDASVLTQEYETWAALGGATILTAPTLSPDGSRFYVSTGLAKGHSNLHAYSMQGELLWQADAWQSASDGVDACAILSSPIVDRDGDIYISDCNQVFAFTPSGEVKWQVDLPAVQAGDWVAAGAHPVNAFTTAAFTAEGTILGVTNFGDIVVLDRATGEQLNQAARLPGLIPPYAETLPMPDSLFGNGLMDAQIREWTWQLIFGGSMRSANTPSVGKNGRIYVVGSSRDEGQGALYGYDLVTGANGLEAKEIFATNIGLGSGSSPALSPSEDQVYVSDEEGWLYGVSAADGRILWKTKTAATAGAVSVASDGTVIALQAHAPALIAVSATGEILWESDFTELTTQLPRSWILGAPVASGNGNPTVMRDAVLVPIMYGYQIPFGIKMPVPVHSTLAAVDLKTGKALKDVLELPDDSSGITVVLPDGTIINSLGASITSGMSPLKGIVDWFLPEGLTQMEAVGGLQVALPIAKDN